MSNTPGFWFLAGFYAVLTTGGTGLAAWCMREGWKLRAGGR